MGGSAVVADRRSSGLGPKLRCNTATSSGGGGTYAASAAVVVVDGCRSVSKSLRNVAESGTSQHGASPIGGPPIGRARGGLEWLIGRRQKSPDALDLGHHRQELHATVAIGTFENVSRKGSTKKLGQRVEQSSSLPIQKARVEGCLGAWGRRGPKAPRAGGVVELRTQGTRAGAYRRIIQRGAATGRP